MLIHNIDLGSAVWFHLDTYIFYLYSNGFVLLFCFNPLDLLEMSHCLTEKFIIRASGVIGSWLFCGFLQMFLPFFILWLLWLCLVILVSTPSSTHRCEVIKSLAFSALFALCRTIFSCWMNSSLSTVFTRMPFLAFTKFAYSHFWLSFFTSSGVRVWWVGRHLV